MKKFLFIAIVCSILISCKKEDTGSSSGSGSNCPTTAACGCSAYTKSQCEANPDCCKWTVGSGCGCR